MRLPASHAGGVSGEWRRVTSLCGFAVPEPGSKAGEQRGRLILITVCGSCHVNNETVPVPRLSFPDLPQHPHHRTLALEPRLHAVKRKQTLLPAAEQRAGHRCNDAQLGTQMLVPIDQVVLLADIPAGLIFPLRWSHVDPLLEKI